VIPITKLYLAELELATLKREYEDITIQIENFCDDIQFKSNFFVSTQLIEWFTCYKQMIDFSYTSVDDIKDYLKDLKNWCKEEEDFFMSHMQSRAVKRDTIHLEQEEKYIHDFIHIFNNELIQSISKSIELECPPNQFLPIFVSLFKGYQLDVPSELSNVKSEGNDGEQSFRIIQSLIKDNFDAIGSKLLDEGKKDILVLLGQALSSLEKPGTKTS